jgi:hypothetical protein
MGPKEATEAESEEEEEEEEEEERGSISRMRSVPSYCTA